MLAGFFEQDRKMHETLSGAPARGDFPPGGPEQIPVDRAAEGGDRISLGGGRYLELRREIVADLERERAGEELRQALFERFYCGNLRIYTPDSIRLCVDLLVRRSMENG